jgi:hypothetical protein
MLLVQGSILYGSNTSSAGALYLSRLYPCIFLHETRLMSA